MVEMNQHGLSRYIPADVRREVRQRSKFGCVICRSGLYQYEHIDPPFETATIHDPDSICCLCGSCHDSVTRGQLSKAMVQSAYQKIRTNSPDSVGPPVGPLDFHDGTAELLVGGLLYAPAVRTVLRYHGWDLIRVTPGQDGDVGRISAVFTDDQGQPVLQLVENEWVGELANWDIEIVGKRITVRRRQGEIALQLRLDPPGRIVVERLDMRFRGCHVLATEKTYAVGRYITPTFLRWVRVNIAVRRSSPMGAAIEFTDAESLEVRDCFLHGTGAELAAPDRSMVMNANAGVMVKPLGIVIASLCGSFDLFEMAVSGDYRLEEMLPVVFTRPDCISRFIATGKLAEASAVPDPAAM